MLSRVNEVVWVRVPCGQEWHVSGSLAFASLNSVSLSSMPPFSEWMGPLVSSTIGNSESSGTPRSSSRLIRGNLEPDGVVQLRRGDKYILLLVSYFLV